MHEVHMRTHDPNKCEDCGAMFWTRHHLDEHVKVNHKVEASIYQQGTTEYETEVLKNEHQENRDSSKCEKCNFEFQTRSQVETHMQTMHGNRKYYCSECELEFLSDKFLNEHLENHSKYDHCCTYCEMKFREMKELEKHVKDDHYQAESSCETGGEKYLTRSSVNEPKNVHSTAMKSCITCEKKF